MSGSFFTLNQKYNSLLALFNQFFPYPPSPYPPPADVMTLSTQQTATALKTFSVLPRSGVVPVDNADFTNKAYVDAQVGSVPTIDAVLGQGDTAIGKQMILTDLVGTQFTTYTPSEIQVSDGVTDTAFFQPTQLQYTDITGTISATWADIISGSASSNTLQEVLTAGATADIGFSLALVGANTSNIINNIDGTSSIVNVGHIDTGAGTTATSTIISQLNQTDYSASVNDTTNGLLGTKTLITIGGAVIDTDTATNSATGAVGLMNRTTATNSVNTGQQLVTGTGITTGYTTGVDASEAKTDLTFLSPTFDIKYGTSSASGGSSMTATSLEIATGLNCLRQESTAYLALNDLHLSNSDTNPAPAIAVSYATQINQTNALVAQNYNDNTLGIVNSIGHVANGGASSAFYGASNTLAGSSHFLRLEVPTLGDALIEHQVIGPNRNLNLTTTGNFLMTSDNLNITTSQISSINASAGTSGTPQLLLTNTNATGAVFTEIYKAKPTAGANGEVLHQQSVFGKDSGNAKQEYTRITHTIRDITAGAEDGSLELGCVTNGTYANYIQLNANDAPIGEVNFTRPLDFIGGSDANSTIKTSGTGSVNLNIDATGSAGTGAIALKTKNGVAGSGGGLLLTGDTLLSGSAGGNSGQHLALTIGGVVYKIKLENP